MSTLAKVAETTAQKTLSSLELAKISGRSHNNILRSIERMNEDLIRMHKTPAEFYEYDKGYNNQKGKMSQLTKYHCELLAMALSGEARIRVLDRLHEMEDQSKTILPTVDSVASFVDTIDLYDEDAVMATLMAPIRLTLKTQRALMKEKKEKDDILSTNKLLERRIEGFEEMGATQLFRRAIEKATGMSAFLSLGVSKDKEEGEEEYMTLMGYMNVKKIKKPQGEMLRIARMATKKCLEEGRKIIKCPDRRYGQVNSYPLDVLRIVV